MQMQNTNPPSPAGLTRGSIFLRKRLLAKRMDCRVKPGNDDRAGLPDPRVTSRGGVSSQPLLPPTAAE
jgi:hypothetical protein